MNCFDDDILTVDENQDIACAQLGRFHLALDSRVEGMSGRGDDLLAAYKDIDPLRSLLYIGFSNSSKSPFTSLFIPDLDIFANTIYSMFFQLSLNRPAGLSYRLCR